MEETELINENDGNSPADDESNTLENNVEETTSRAADLEMSNEDTTLEGSQDDNIDSQQKEDAVSTD